MQESSPRKTRNKIYESMAWSSGHFHEWHKTIPIPNAFKLYNGVSHTLKQNGRFCSPFPLSCILLRKTKKNKTKPKKQNGQISFKLRQRDLAFFHSQILTRLKSTKDAAGLFQGYYLCIYAPNISQFIEKINAILTGSKN